MTSSSIEQFVAVMRHIRLDRLLPIGSVVVLIVLGVKSAVFDHWGLVVAICIFVGLLSLSIWTSFTHRASLVPNFVLQAALVVLIFCTVVYLEAAGAVWVFPALVWLRFAISDTTSNAMMGLLVVGVPVILVAQGDWPHAARLVLAMGLALGYLWLVEGELLSLRQRLGPEKSRDSLTDMFTYQQLERDIAKMTDGASVGLLLVQVDNFLELREVLGPDSADEVVKSISSHMQSFLSGKERLYRIGAADLLVGLPGWRAYECFELGQRIGMRLSTHMPGEATLRFGVSESIGKADFGDVITEAYRSLTPWSAQGPK